MVLGLGAVSGYSHEMMQHSARGSLQRVGPTRYTSTTSRILVLPPLSFLLVAFGVLGRARQRNGSDAQPPNTGETRNSLTHIVGSTRQRA